MYYCTKWICNYNNHANIHDYCLYTIVFNIYIHTHFLYPYTKKEESNNKLIKKNVKQIT